MKTKVLLGKVVVAVNAEASPRREKGVKIYEMQVLRGFLGSPYSTQNVHFSPAFISCEGFANTECYDNSTTPIRGWNISSTYNPELRSARKLAILAQGLHSKTHFVGKDSEICLDVLSIISSIPFAFIILLMVGCLFKELKAETRAAGTFR